MIGKTGQGWAVTFADLSIILFMITAADLSRSKPADHAPESMPLPASVAMAEPVAVFRPAAGVPLSSWLAQQPADPRQLVTVLVRHPADGMSGAMEAGLRLAREAQAAGRSTRVIAEDCTAADISVTLTYDSSPQAGARNLLGVPDVNQPEESP